LTFKTDNMKKLILLAAATLISYNAIPQQPGSKVKPIMADMTREWDDKHERLNNAESFAANVRDIKAEDLSTINLLRSAPNAAISWNPISGSMNAYGVLVSNAKALQYNNELNAVSFIHRKSPTYLPNPYPTPVGAETGAIVGMVTTNWGTTWDSTCIWNDNNNWARYPSGAITNPVISNTLISSAYIVASGPITQANDALGWIGNFYASKSLTSFDNVASTAPNAQQFIQSESPPFPPTGKVDYARVDFTATDDGVLRVMGGIYNDPDGTTVAAQGYKGPRIIKGTFNSGVYSWTGTDSLPILVTADPQDGSLNWFGGRHNMAWNEEGTIGYAWYYGCRINATGNSRGFQPIVFKSTNGGPWTAMNSIDFNDKAKFKKPVLDHLFPAVLDTASIIPFFNFREGFDGTVDANGQLHIMATLWSSSKSHDETGMVKHIHMYMAVPPLMNFSEPRDWMPPSG
jgi:hypothetical protein